MFNSFLNKLKTNLLYLKNNVLFFLKLIKFTFLINIFYFSFIYSCLVQTNSSNTFIGGLVYGFFLFISVNYSLLLFLLFYYTLSVKSLLFKKIQNITSFKKNKFLVTNNSIGKKNFNNILLSFNYYVLGLEFIKSILSYIYSLYFFYVKYILKNLFLTNYLFNTITKLVTKVSWYPIFKRHSVFGYYRINRQRWVELKSEEMNYIKY
jgi:hypothetical protein